MTTTKAQNHLNKYFKKVQDSRFDEENGVLQTEKQLDKKQKIEDNIYDRFVIASAKLTEDQYNGLEGVEDLCFSYEEMLEDYEYTKFR